MASCTYRRLFFVSPFSSIPYCPSLFVCKYRGGPRKIIIDFLFLSLYFISRLINFPYIQAFRFFTVISIIYARMKISVSEELSTSGPLHLPSHQSGHHLTLLESRRPASGPSHYHHHHSATAPAHSSSIDHSTSSNSSSSSSQHLPNSQLQDLTNANFVLPPTHSHGNCE